MENPDKGRPEISRMFALPRWLARAMRLVALFVDHLRPVRVPLLVVALAAACTLAVDQVAELFLMATMGGGSPHAFIYLWAGSGLLGLAVWYQSRNAYRLRHPRWPALQDADGAGLRAWLPRFLGISIPVLVALGCIVAGKGMEKDAAFWLRMIALGALAVVLFAFFRARRFLVNKRRRRHGRHLLRGTPAEERRLDSLRGLGPAAAAIFILALVANVVVTVLIAWRPYWLDGAGPLGIVMLAGIFLCLSGGAITIWADRIGFPVLSALAALALVLHWNHWNDNHQVRVAPGADTTKRTIAKENHDGLTFDDYRRRWLLRHCQPGRPCPLVLVSSEGGGIRAAAWTGLVLSELEMASRKQGRSVLDQTFAGSGVSGGSLGLATVVALRRDGTPAQGLKSASQRFLSHDFLAPTLANMLFVDFTQRLLPGALFDDRGRALTLAWETDYRNQWKAAGRDTDSFAQPLKQLYANGEEGIDPRMPALFLNSTVVGDGGRFVQHPFEALPREGDRSWFATTDGADYGVREMPVSEVVLNSARFTYVSPAGTLRNKDGAIQLVDGGYYENSGTTTLLDVIKELRSDLPAGYQLQLRVIHISNDPGINPMMREDAARPLRANERCPTSLQAGDQALHGDASAPLVALMATRGARGQYAREALARATLEGDSAREALVAALGDNDQLWHFRLCKGNYVIPLGWTISEGVFKEMERQLVWTGEKQGGRYQLDQIAAAIFAPGSNLPQAQPAQPPTPPEQSAAQEVPAGAGAQAQ